MSKPPLRKVLYLVTEDGYFLSHRLPLAQALLAKGDAVAVACRISPQAEGLRAQGITVFSIPFVRGSLNPWHELKTLWAIFKLYRQWCPDVVHHVAFKPALYGTFCARLLRVPRIINAIAGFGIFAVDRRLKILQRTVLSVFRWLMRSPRCYLIVQNQEDAAVLGCRQATLIPGAGVNTDIFKPVARTPKETTQVIMVSRLLWSKGVGELVAAARQLKAHGIEVILVGKPDLQNPDHIPQQQLQDWHREGCITWLGHRQDIAQLYQQADIAILPSYYGEGIPKTLLEAAACGKPIITTNHPGCRDVVTDDVNGILVPPQDARTLAKAILKLHQNPALREQMGQQSRQRAVNDFKEEKIVKATLALY